MREMFVKMFSASSMSRDMVFRWHSWFVVGKESIADPERSSRPGTMKMNENIARVAAVLKDNRCGSCRMTAESTYGILKTIIHRILSDDLKK